METSAKTSEGVNITNVVEIAEKSNNILAESGVENIFVELSKRVIQRRKEAGTRSSAGLSASGRMKGDLAVDDLVDFEQNTKRGCICG